LISADHGYIMVVAVLAEPIVLAIINPELLLEAV
jgi:hypothetical protein